MRDCLVLDSVKFTVFYFVARSVLALYFDLCFRATKSCKVSTNVSSVLHEFCTI